MDNVKFSIIIPTHNRPELLAVAVKYAMQVDYANFEVIVSDNSATDSIKRSNNEVVSKYIGEDNFRIVRPPQLLSPPEHFEFALDFASGDYVLYLTDKMVLLPHILTQAAEIISSCGAEIVNWSNAPYQIESTKYPSGPGTLILDDEFLEGGMEIYDPKAALAYKASCNVPRHGQSAKVYVQGKIIFGCYSKDLINQILENSGTMFCGATHDYSAMVQALSVAKTCVMLNTYGIIFISLPPDQSLGSLTDYDSQQALNYYKSFTNAQSILSNLLIPEVYASQHNMVAHDYKKFLPIYGNDDLFNEHNWFKAIYEDLTSNAKVWRDVVEKNQQLRLLKNKIGWKYVLLKILNFYKFLIKTYNANRIVRGVKARLPIAKTIPAGPQINRAFTVQSLSEAVRLISIESHREPN